MMASALVWSAVAAWAVLGVYTSVTDLRRAIIPRRAVWQAGSLVAALLAAAAGVVGDPLRLAWAAVAAAAVGLFLEVAYRTLPGRVGFGDVRLIIVNSLLAGWWGVQWSWWALGAGAVAALPAGVVSLARKGRAASVRWAPGLVVGTATVLALRIWAAGPV